jgi:nucleoside-diphosphate-sugar epimerase
VKKAEQFLGFRAHVELEQGLHDTIEWYRRKLNGEV